MSTLMLPVERLRGRTRLALTMLLGCAPWSLHVAAATAPGSPPVPSAAQSVTPPPLHTAQAPPLAMLEYLGDLQQDDEGWFGPEDINDEAEPSPRAASPGDDAQEVPPQ